MKKVAVLVGLGLLAGSPNVFAHADHGKPLTEIEQQASKGVFEDSDVKDRSLSDWEGIWQSIYPYLLSGDLTPVLEKKAKTSGKSITELETYYKKGYATDINMISIENNVIEFHVGKDVTSCHYSYAGYKILNYVSGKKGVRYLFDCKDSLSKAPKYVQFSDHIIGPRQSLHFHIYTSNESQAALLKQMDNWPTFYPYNLTKTQIVDEMLHH